VQNRTPITSQDTGEARTLKLELKGFVSEARRLSEQLDPLVSSYEKQSSEFLAGALGGVTAGGLLLFFWGYGVIHTGLALILGAPAILLGILIMLLIFRGPEQWRQERSRKRLRSELKYLREELEALSDLEKVPSNISSEIWLLYRERISFYNRRSSRGLAP